MQSVRSRSSVVLLCRQCLLLVYDLATGQEFLEETEIRHGCYLIMNGISKRYLSVLFFFPRSMPIFIRMRGFLTRFQALLFVREKENSGLSYKIVPQFKKIHLVVSSTIRDQWS